MRRFAHCVSFVIVAFSSMSCTDGNKEASRSAEATKILERVKAVYAQCRSYSDSGVVRTESKGDKVRVEKKPFSTAFLRPNRFRFQYTYDFFDSNDEKGCYIIWSDGSNVREWWNGRLEKKQSLDLAIWAATGVSSRSSCNIPALLLPDEITGMTLVEITDPVRLEDATINQIRCHRVKGNYGRRPTTLWIDAKTFLIRRIEEKYSMPTRQVQVTTITTYEPTINEDIEGKSLEFGVPDNGAGQEP